MNFKHRWSQNLWLGRENVKISTHSELKVLIRYFKKNMMHSIFFCSLSASFFYLLCGKNRLSLDSLFIIYSNLFCINTKELNFQLETIWACSCRWCRGKSCSWSGRRCAVWGTVSLATTPSITPWTPWSRACPASWTDYTLWTASAGRTEGYTDSHTHTAATSSMMTHQHMSLDCLLFVIVRPFRRNLNRRDAEPTQQTVTPGRRARVRQTKKKSLFSLGFVILCYIATLAVKSDCAVHLHCYAWMRGWSRFRLRLWNCLLFFVIISRNGSLTQQPGLGHDCLH